MAYKKRKSTARKRISSRKPVAKRRRSVSKKTTSAPKKFSDKELRAYVAAVKALRGEEE